GVGRACGIGPAAGALPVKMLPPERFGPSLSHGPSAASGSSQSPHLRFTPGLAQALRPHTRQVYLVLLAFLRALAAGSASRDCQTRRAPPSCSSRQDRSNGPPARM